MSAAAQYESDAAQKRRSTLRRLTSQDRRRYRRIIYSLPARCMWKNGEEFEAVTVDIGGGGLSLKTEQPFEIGRELVVYVDNIGRLAGRVARPTEFGFAVSVSLVPLKRDRVIDLLTWMVNKEALGLDDERKSSRRFANGSLQVAYDTGVVVQCDVIELFLTGVALRTTGPCPEIGSRVKVGGKIGRCARLVEGGFAVDFQ